MMRTNFFSKRKHSSSTGPIGGYRNLCLGCCKPAPPKFSDTEETSVYFQPVAFLPEFVRNAIKTGLVLRIPTSIKMSVVLLEIEVPVSRELTEIYLDNVDVQGNVIHEIKMFFSSIIDLCENEGADVFRFIDSTLKCMWEVKDEEYAEAIVFVLELVIHIKKKICKEHSTGFWNIMTISAISAGEVNILFVGDPNSKILWTVVGEIVNEGRAGRLCAELGDVIITKSAWERVSLSTSIYTVTEIQKGFTKVEKISQEDIFDWAYDSPVYERCEELEKLYNAYRDHIEKWVYPLVPNAVTMQQLEIISSMTNVVVVALFVTDLELSTADELNDVSQIVMKITDQHEGILTKLDYQEGIVFCTCFGSIGFKHNDDGVRSLYWARDVTESLKQHGYSGVVRISTGLCYSGVVGPLHRMEIALIGKPLLSTLTLIHEFPDIPIVCESRTVLRCRRDVGNIFTLITNRTVKLKNIPACYAVDFLQSPEKTTIKCVGRDHEKEFALKILSDLKEGVVDLADKLPLIVIKGERGCGKSNFLKFISQEATTLGFTSPCFVANIPYEETFEKAWYIVKEVLAANYVDKESEIVELLGANVSEYPLHLLNNHFDTKFPVQNRSSTEEMEPVLLRKMVVNLLKECAKGNPILIAIDNCEHIAEQTSLFLYDLLVTRIAIIMVSITEPFKPDTSNIQRFLDHCYEIINFEALPEASITSLACHFLNVVAIHKDFLRFLCKHSQGNPLRLQEIILLPQLQHHLCLVQFQSIIPTNLERSFVTPNENDTQDVKEKKVCDILDLASLQDVYVPVHLLDVVKEHTSGLSPAEQMLMKKCACLGENFSLFILEAVCPEYTSDSLRNSVVKLVRKNLLTIGCSHLIIVDSGVHQNIHVEYSAEEFCPHLIKFTSEFLRQCVVNFMPGGQLERLHLFIVSLLMGATITCNSCRTCSEIRTLPTNECFPCEVQIPKLNLFNCHCSDFQASIYMQIDYHLTKGNAEVERRVKLLSKAAETAFETENLSLVGTFLDMAKRISDSSNYAYPERIKVIMQRLLALKCNTQGEAKEGLEIISESLSLLGRDFPSGYEKKLSLPILNNDFFGEEIQSVGLGCILLLELCRYKEAYEVAKKLVVFMDRYTKCMPDEVQSNFVKTIIAQTMLFISGAKASKSKSKRRMKKSLHRLLEMCCSKLQARNELNFLSIHTIIIVLSGITDTLLEKNDLSLAETIGFRAFQIAKITNGVKELIIILPNLCLIYYFRNDTSKCFAILGEFLDAARSAGDLIAEALYYGILAKVLLRMDNPEIRCDKVRMCTDFATSKCHNVLPACDKKKKYWITTMMSVWCLNHASKDVFLAWHAKAVQLRKSVPLASQFSLVSELRMEVINAALIKESASSMETTEVAKQLNDVRLNINDIEERVNRYACVLESEVKQAKILFEQIVTDIAHMERGDRK